MRLNRKQKRAIIARTIELLTPAYAWGRGSWRKTNAKAPDGVQMCLLGGLQQAYEDVTGKKDTSDGGCVAEELSLVTLIRAKGGYQHGSPAGIVFMYNDNKSTKKSDILKLLREKEAELA